MASGGRCARITADGSTGTTSRSGDSYEPAPAPTFTTLRASPSARSIAAAKPGRARSIIASLAVSEMRKWPGASRIAPGITRTSCSASRSAKATSSGQGDFGKR